MTDLFAAIDAHLDAHAEKMAGRARLVAASERSRYDRELWAAIRPFVRSESDFRAAATFMAHMTREHARD